MHLILLDVILKVSEWIASLERIFLHLTGQDASDKALQNIREGRQAMTIYKDPNVLCAKVVRMVKAVVEGSQPAINDVQNIKNDVKTIPSYLCIPAIVDKENIDVVKK